MLYKKVNIVNLVPTIRQTLKTHLLHPIFKDHIYSYIIIQYTSKFMREIKILNLHFQQMLIQGMKYKSFLEHKKKTLKQIQKKKKVVASGV